MVNLDKISKIDKKIDFTPLMNFVPKFENLPMVNLSKILKTDKKRLDSILNF